MQLRELLENIMSRNVKSKNPDYKLNLRCVFNCLFQYNNPDSDWPAKDECDTYVQKVPDPRNLSTIYLSPENKGFE